MTGPALEAPTRALRPQGTRSAVLLGRLALLVVLLFGFLVAIQLMSGSFADLGRGSVGGDRGMLAGVRHPIAALAVGVLATVLVQSSSTTTAVIVSLVGVSGGLSVETAVPMIFGANIGTTITNTLVAMGSVRRSEEFRRAFAAATAHDFFNLLAVSVMLPIELATGALARSAGWLTARLTGGAGVAYDSPVKQAVKATAKGLRGLAAALGLDGTPLAVVCLVAGVLLTFLCLVHLTRTMRRLIAGRLERAINDALGRSGLIGIAIGLVVTMAVQSSSVTTSLLVPMCAAGVLSLRNAFPIMLGANLGTTVTALLASLAVDDPNGLTIALVHVLFNSVGVALVWGLPPVREVPPRLAEGLAALAVRNRLWIAVYVLGVFVALPLVLWKLIG